MRFLSDWGQCLKSLLHLCHGEDSYCSVAVSDSKGVKRRNRHNGVIGMGRAVEMFFMLLRWQAVWKGGGGIMSDVSSDKYHVRPVYLTTA